MSEKTLLLPLHWRLNTNLFPDFGKSKEYLSSAVIVATSKPCVLLSICTEKPISTPKIMTFLSKLLSGNENNERESNPIS